jgi:uncharacterized RDD family membrane protein YckC
MGLEERTVAAYLIDFVCWFGVAVAVVALFAAVALATLRRLRPHASTPLAVFTLIALVAIVALFAVAMTAALRQLRPR